MAKNITKNNEIRNEIDMEDESCPLRKGAILIKFLPSTITISAFCVGLTSIRFALFHRWELAALCIFVAALLDALDGKVARQFGQSSQFGAQLDSLSDLVCFGVAPPIILFLKSVCLLGSVGWGVCMFFTVCCALRLARFNVSMLQDEEKPAWEKRYFKGIPAPAGAILVITPVILFFQTGSYAFLNPWFIFGGLLVSGVLMISTIRTFSSKILEISKAPAVITLSAISVFVICLITEIWLTLTILVTLYLFMIPYGAYKYAQTKKEEDNVGATTNALPTE
ncbi:MAG: CDP-diacylglycerol--serine O-phosphatidyltransferase [Holosporaceae bacterium]|jgi:CDP-diacylglycerol--serine O-phosphatidyltransferase|nr:CDP-diacylglycerol--serine O-phosphatidyltransferase [Holosporaceae bacterium]